MILFITIISIFANALLTILYLDTRDFRDYWKDCWKRLDDENCRLRRELQEIKERQTYENFSYSI